MYWLKALLLGAIFTTSLFIARGKAELSAREWVGIFCLNLAMSIAGAWLPGEEDNG